MPAKPQKGRRGVDIARLANAYRALPVTLDGASSADWDQQGRLVFAAGGQILTGALMADGAFVQRVLLDLNSSKPIGVAAPDWAAHW